MRNERPETPGQTFERLQHDALIATQEHSAACILETFYTRKRKSAFASMQEAQSRYRAFVSLDENKEYLKGLGFDG